MVHHDRDRVSDKAEEEPEEDVVELGVLEIPLESGLNVDERHVAHHCCERQEVVHFEGEGDDELVEHS